MFQGSRLQTVTATQCIVGGNIICQSTIQLTAVQFRNGTAVQQDIDLTETGQAEQTCHVRVLLQNIIQGVQTGQGIRQDRCILQSGIAQQMDLGADLTDTDHVSLSQSIRASGIGHIYFTVGDQMQCSHGLPIAIYSFPLL